MISLHRYTLLTTACTFLLILAGAAVTSTGSGLAVPDWPLSYGQFFPPMIGGVLFEHGHRMIAGTVGILMTGLALWTLLTKPGKEVRVLAGWAWLAVLIQALLGGMTVLYQLPKSVSIAHACLAQTFFCLLVALSLFTSPSWQSSHTTLYALPSTFLKPLSIITTITLYIQLILGASLRHEALGPALHIIGGIVVTLLCLATAILTLQHAGDQPERTTPAYILSALVLTQLALGIFSYIGKKPVITVTHVGMGALILATSLILALCSFRAREVYGN